MIDICKIIKSGLLTTVQDLGRYGYQKDGIVASGAMDRYSFQIANLLVGNPRNTASLEITMIGPKIEFLENTMIAITGAEANVLLDGKRISLWKSVKVKKDQILTFQAVTKGCRLYLAVHGGFIVRRVLNSQSTYLAANIGGYNGRELNKGDILQGTKLIQFPPFQRKLDHALIPVYNKENVIRVICGPEFDCFTRKGISIFFRSKYKVAIESNRMGYRIEGDPIEHVRGADIFSDAVTFGTIQVPSDGQPIILMADRQTTGGYTRIANVISVDLQKLAQLIPGSIIRFQEVTVTEGHNLYREQEKLLKKLEIGVIKTTS